MQDKGLDFKHKEVVNISNGKRLRICSGCLCRFRNRNNNFYDGCKKENRYNRFEFDREHKKKKYITRKGEKGTGYLIREKYIYDVVCKVEL